MSRGMRFLFVAVFIVSFGATYGLLDMAARAFQQKVWHPLTTGAAKECNP
jgi:hypothetical protein